MDRRSFARALGAAALVPWLPRGTQAQGLDAPTKPLALVGQLLVGSPKIEDVRFREAVIYVARHDERGAFGVVINRPQGTGPIEQILRAYRLRGPTTDVRVTVYWGGPNDSQRGYVVHSTDYGLDVALMTSGNLAVTRVESMVLAIAENRGPRLTLIAYGACNWGPGQLDREVMAGQWMVIPPDEKLIFAEPDASKWQRAFATFGIEL